MSGRTAPLRWWPALPLTIGWQRSWAPKQRGTFSGLGAANFRVGSGYWLRLPVFGWYTSQGHCLEGKGVSPDVVVQVDPVLLNAGIDQQMERAMEILNATKQDSGRAARA